jgi:hypothetical protein
MDGVSHEKPTRLPLLAIDGHCEQQVPKKPEAPGHPFFTQTRVKMAERREAAKGKPNTQAKGTIAKRQGDVIDATMERPRKTPRLTFGVVGIGTSSVASRKLNSSVNDGTFVLHPAKWAKFQQKIYILDKHAEFPDRDVRLVRHSKCGGELRMKEPYNIANFETHISSCKGPSKKANLSAADTPTLDSMFKNHGWTKNALPARPSATQKLVPCPGLTVSDEGRIPEYLLRSPSCGGGGPCTDSVRAKMYPEVAFAKLTNLQKDAIRAAQRQQYQWRNEEDLQRVVSTSCKKESLPRPDNTVVPCIDCQNLLKLKSFKKVLSIALPDPKNLKFTPKVWRDVRAAEKWGSYTGLKPLMEAYAKVSIFVRYFGFDSKTY